MIHIMLFVELRILFLLQNLLGVNCVVLKRANRKGRADRTLSQRLGGKQTKFRTQFPKYLSKYCQYSFCVDSPKLESLQNQILQTYFLAILQFDLKSLFCCIKASHINVRQPNIYCWPRDIWCDDHVRNNKEWREEVTVSYLFLLSLLKEK